MLISLFGCAGFADFLFGLLVYFVWIGLFAVVLVIVTRGIVVWLFVCLSVYCCYVRFVSVIDFMLFVVLI